MKKVLVLGLGGFEARSEKVQLESCDWKNLRSVDNVKDFDEILVVLPTSGDWGKADWEGFAVQFNPSNAADLLWSGVRIVIVGDPRGSIPWHSVTKGYDGPPLLFAGIHTEWEGLAGDRVERLDVGDAGLAGHLSRVKRYSFALHEWSPHAWLAEAFNRRQLKGSGQGLEVDVTPLLVTRSGDAIAFRVRYSVRDRSGGSRYLPGCVIQIPRTDRAVEVDVADLARAFWALDLDTPEPDWVARLLAPGEESLLDELRQLQQEHARVEDAIEHVENERRTRRRVLGLVYAQGLAFEALVRDALRELGAMVEEPSGQNEEDGWIEVSVGAKVYRAVMEIGATRSETHSEDRIRQLLGWVDKSIKVKGEIWRGLFVGSAGIDRPPAERQDPFADQWIKRARSFGFSVLRGDQLLEAIRRSREGTLDREVFWQTVFEAEPPVASESLFQASV